LTHLPGDLVRHSPATRREPKITSSHFETGLAIAAVVTGLNLLHFRGFKPGPLLSPATLYDLLKIVFAFAAGIGGVIVLVTAYRRRRVAELAQDLARQQYELAAAPRSGPARTAGKDANWPPPGLLNKRFTTATFQLGRDQPAVRLAGVYAMPASRCLAAQQQTCVDVLGAYLPMPYEPDPGATRARH
jgi:hypothetical protein